MVKFFLLLKLLNFHLCPAVKTPACSLGLGWTMRFVLPGHGPSRGVERAAGPAPTPARSSKARRHLSTPTRFCFSEQRNNTSRLTLHLQFYTSAILILRITDTSHCCSLEAAAALQGYPGRRLLHCNLSRVLRWQTPSDRPPGLFSSTILPLNTQKYGRQ